MPRGDLSSHVLSKELNNGTFLGSGTIELNFQLSQNVGLGVLLELAAR